MSTFIILRGIYLHTHSPLDYPLLLMNLIKVIMERTVTTPTMAQRLAQTLSMPRDFQCPPRAQPPRASVPPIDEGLKQASNLMETPFCFQPGTPLLLESSTFSLLLSSSNHCSGADSTSVVSLLKKPALKCLEMRVEAVDPQEPLLAITFLWRLHFIW